MKLREQTSSPAVILTDNSWTAVSLQYRKRRLNHRLLFGQPEKLVRRGWHRKIALFECSQVFGYERWAGDRFGTQSWRVFICQAGSSNNVSVVPGIHPGADILLSANGARRVKRTLGVLDELREMNPTLEAVQSYQWRQIHNWIETGCSGRDLLDRVADLKCLANL